MQEGCRINNFLGSSKGACFAPLAEGRGEGIAVFRCSFFCFAGRKKNGWGEKNVGNSKKVRIFAKHIS